MQFLVIAYDGSDDKAMERVVPMLIRDAVRTASANGGKIVFIPLHWGIDALPSIASCLRLPPGGH